MCIHQVGFRIRGGSPRPNRASLGHDTQRGSTPIHHSAVFCAVRHGLAATEEAFVVGLSAFVAAVSHAA